MAGVGRDKRRKMKKGSGFYYRKFRVKNKDRTFDSGMHQGTRKTKAEAQKSAKAWQKNGHFTRVTKEKAVGSHLKHHKNKGKSVYRVWVMVDTTGTPQRKRKPRK